MPTRYADLAGVAGGRDIVHRARRPRMIRQSSTRLPLVVVLTDWIRYDSARRPNVPVRGALG